MNNFIYEKSAIPVTKKKGGKKVRRGGRNKNKNKAPERPEFEKREQGNFFQNSQQDFHFESKV